MMKKVLFLLSLMLVFAVSCGNSEPVKPDKQERPADQSDSADTPEETDHADSGQPSDPAEPTSDPTDQTEPTNPTDPTGQAEPSEEPDSDKDPDEPQEPEDPAADKFCQYACTKAADCIRGSSTAISDEDNYKCENGRCVYLGCLSDAECDEVYGAVTEANGQVYRCNKNGAYGYPECTPICSSVEDCNLYGYGSTQYAYDLDNYKCESGFCVYTGCLSDAECAASTYSDLYKCLPQEYPGKTLKICTVGCQTAADCPNSGLYECRDSVCVMKSCESDEWCREYDKNYSCL